MTTESEIRAAIGTYLWNFQKLYDRANSSASITDPLDETVGDFTALAQEPWGNAAVAAIGRVRSGYSALLDPATIRAGLDPMFREYARIKGYPESIRTVDEIVDRLFEDFIDDSDSVARRNPTFGSVTADGGNTGDGTILRCTTDGYSEVIENITPEAKSFRCIADARNGRQEHQELFEVRGASANFDFLEVSGSGRVGRISALSALDTAQFVQNPSWTNGSGTATVTSLPGWTPGAGAGTFTNIERDSSNTYRGGDGAATQYALKFTTTESVTQALSTKKGTFRSDVPYVCQVAWNRSVGSASGGNVVLTLGSNTASVALAAQSGWQILRIALDQNSWLRDWNGSAPTVKVEWTSASSGTLLVDDLILAPMTQFDGSFWAAVGGATSFLREDLFTFTDSVSTESVVQWWLWYALGRYLPSSASPTWADPT